MMHLGARVSALLDGRLPAAEEDRAWAHVHECHPCRDLVEREGWVKTRLAGLSFADRSECEAPDRLKISLLGCGSATAPAPFPTSNSSVWSRHRSLVVIGGGAAGAAVFGVLALGAANNLQLERRAPVTDLSRPSQIATPTVDTQPSTRPAKKASKRQRALRQGTPSTDPTPLVVVLHEVPRVRMAP